MTANKSTKMTSVDKSFFRSRYGNTVQINENTEEDGDGNVYKRSLLLNIRADSVEEAAELYRDLKTRLNGEVATISNESKKATEKGPICDKCGKKMILRNSRFGSFYGCLAYPTCANTKQVDEVREIMLETVPL